MRKMPASLSALGSSSGLRRVLLAYLLSGIVETATWLAIVLYAYARGGPSLAGLVVVGQVLPAAFVAPLLAGLGDRMTRGAALVLAYAFLTVATAVTLIALVVNAPVLVVVAGATLCTIGHAVARPNHFAVLPQLARSPEQLVSANALSTIADGIALFAGPLAAGFGAALVGPWLVFAAGVAVLVITALLCLGLGLAAPVTTDGGGAAALRQAFEGVGALWGDWPALALLAILTSGFVVIGAMDVLAVTFSEVVLGQGEAGAGGTLSGVGIGVLVGGVVAGVLALRRRLAPVVLIGGLLMGAAVTSVSLLTHVGTTATALAVSGLGGAVLLVAGRTLLQRTSDERLLARIFAVQESASLVGMAVGAAVAPVLIERTSPADAFVPFGAATAIVALAGYLLIRQLDARAVLRPAEAALLRRVAFLAVLPPYDLERLARHAAWVDCASGDVVIRQGDPGTTFFVVGAGTFAVTVGDGNEVAELGPGDGFGEVALMQAVARTATVTARTRGRLLAIRDEEFLAAVTGSVDGHALAVEVSRAHVARDVRPRDR